MIALIKAYQLLWLQGLRVAMARVKESDAAQAESLDAAGDPG